MSPSQEVRRKNATTAFRRCDGRGADVAELRIMVQSCKELLKWVQKWKCMFHERAVISEMYTALHLQRDHKRPDILG